MTETIELPPMPNPAYGWYQDYYEGWCCAENPRDRWEELQLYTEEQMTAYALLAVKQERERLWSEVRAALIAELDHAAVNGTSLSPSFGRSKGDDAVRAGHIMAVVERFDAAIRLAHPA